MSSFVDTPSQGETPLHWAAREGHVEVCDFLLKKGADKEAKINTVSSPLCAGGFFR